MFILHIRLRLVDICQKFLQAAAVPSILADGDVVMAAETGSGKTQAYLAPLFNKLLETKQTQIDAVGSQTLVERGSLERQNFALVLCPNAMLCEQVMQMANTLCDSLGTPLLKVSVVSGGQVSFLFTKFFRHVSTSSVCARLRVCVMRARLVYETSSVWTVCVHVF